MATLAIVISISAVAVSIVSVLIGRHHWRETYRPPVTAFVDEHWPGETSSAFDLVVANSGTRPAVGIRLVADPVDIERLIEPGAPEHLANEVRSCFSAEAIIAVLRNGEELRTAFGSYQGEQSPSKWINYGAQINVRVEYNDLQGRCFVERMPLRIFVRQGFAGTVWTRTKRPVKP